MSDSDPTTRRQFYKEPALAAFTPWAGKHRREIYAAASEEMLARFNWRMFLANAAFAAISFAVAMTKFIKNDPTGV